MGTMKNLYWDFDMKAVYLAQKSVNAWNWTTGKRKADLANTLYKISGVVDTGSFLFSQIPELAIPWGFVSLMFIPLTCDLHKLLEKTEDQIAKGGNKIDSYSGMRAISNLNLVGMAALPIVLPDFFPKEGIAAGMGLRAFAAYVMRADNPSAGKNVFSRAKDKLVDKVKKVSERLPSPVPAPGMYGVGIAYNYGFIPKMA